MGLIEHIRNKIASYFMFPGEGRGPGAEGSSDGLKRVPGSERRARRDIRPSPTRLAPALDPGLRRGTTRRSIKAENAERRSRKPRKSKAQGSSERRKGSSTLANSAPSTQTRRWIGLCVSHASRGRLTKSVWLNVSPVRTFVPLMNGSSTKPVSCRILRPT